MNHRLKNREVETLENDQNESNEVAEKEEVSKSDNDSDGISINESISPNENENITENNGKGFIEEIVSDIFLSSWKEIIKVIPTNNKKMKVYPCFSVQANTVQLRNLNSQLLNAQFAARKS